MKKTKNRHEVADGGRRSVGSGMWGVVVGSSQTPRGAYASWLVGEDCVRECASGAGERKVPPKMGARMLVGSGGGVGGGSGPAPCVGVARW